MRHIIDLCDLTEKEFSDLYKLTTNIIDRPEGYTDACRGKVLGSLFYEPSTRTNLSFSTAMMRLGGSVVGFSDPGSSSTTKGETLKDTINMVSSYADLIVMRNPREGAAKAASLYSSVPVINAGDGGHLHPTQTLTDMVTILRYRGSADDMKIGLCGDLKYGRTVHSLLHFLERYHNVQIYLISPDVLALPDYMVQFLKAHNMPFCQARSIEEVLPELDVLYMTRIQRERFSSAQEYENLEGNYQLTAEKMKRAKRDMLVLHPLPRVDEIAQDVDDDPRAVYFRQARFGMFGRMALLLTLSKLPFVRAGYQDIGAHGVRCTNPKCITHSEAYLPLEGTAGARCPYCDAPLEAL
ncbi:MAG TPA: aspartate carbamoyltransferase [Candidatus Agathobaculum merdavium]|nr:aspartate carbamoyltransferase [Candidatus Agathobaculum merdavium]